MFVVPTKLPLRIGRMLLTLSDGARTAQFLCAAGTNGQNTTKD
jgi:hypothetical protein